jgi:hypothetical protein
MTRRVPEACWRQALRWNRGVPGRSTGWSEAAAMTGDLLLAWGEVVRGVLRPYTYERG